MVSFQFSSLFQMSLQHSLDWIESKKISGCLDLALFFFFPDFSWDSWVFFLLQLHFMDQLLVGFLE